MASNEPQTSADNEPQASANNEPQANPKASTGNGPSGSIEPQAASAAGGTAEDAQAGYRALVEQLMSQNKALIEQNRSLQGQFGILIRSGASVGRHGDSDPIHDSGNAGNAGNVQDMGQNEPYVSLAELGREIGRRDYGSHNSAKE